VTSITIHRIANGKLVEKWSEKNLIAALDFHWANGEASGRGITEVIARHTPNHSLNRPARRRRLRAVRSPPVNFG